MLSFPTVRLRRLRQNPQLRSLIKETELNLNDLVVPLFIKGLTGPKMPIATMPGYYHIPLEQLEQEVEELNSLGLSAVILFGIPSFKDSQGSEALESNGIIPQAIRKIKAYNSNLLVISDLCFCEYTDHGHCGFLSEHRGHLALDNDQTLTLLVKQAISHAEAGSDLIAPSGMIDGMIGILRQGLDRAGFSYLPLLSYAVKYNSSFYGPFRAAAEGSAKFGDRSSHQMDIANSQEALREALLDVNEGADMLMVKPAHTYLDVIYRVKQAHPSIPLGAYHTSGEYAMIKAASQQGWLEEKKGVLEVLSAIKRAGADFIISYYSKQLASWGLI